MATGPTKVVPDIFEATLASDGTDAVDQGRRLTRDEAEARRSLGQDIVVCGPDTIANDMLASEIEAAVSAPGGKAIHHPPHLGPESLPHWQQLKLPPSGHSFYETPLRKARKTA